MAKVVGTGGDGGDDFRYDTGSGWRDDEPPLEHLSDFLAPGSRLVYSYRPVASIGGATGWLKLSPRVEIFRHANRATYILGMHVSAGDVSTRCFLTYDEIEALIKYLEIVVSPCDPDDHSERRIACVRYETASGFAIEQSCGFHIEVYRKYQLKFEEMEELLSGCRAVIDFLRLYRSE